MMEIAAIIDDNSAQSRQSAMVVAIRSVEAERNETRSFCAMSLMGMILTIRLDETP